LKPDEYEDDFEEGKKKHKPKEKSVKLDLKGPPKKILVQRNLRNFSSKVQD